MKGNKELRKFMKDLKKKRSFRFAIEKACEARFGKILKTKEEKMKDCLNCKYSQKCSDEMKDQHWYYTYSVLYFGKLYTFELCTYIISRGFRKSFPNLTAEKR